MTGARPGRGESGFSLVAIVVGIAVMLILLTAAVPVWKTVVQRSREQELIFRGQQYVDAIIHFYNVYHRYPLRLDELTTLEKRCIRKLYEDPMSKDGRWVLIFATHEGPPKVRSTLPGGSGLMPMGAAGTGLGGMGLGGRQGEGFGGEGLGGEGFGGGDPFGGGQGESKPPGGPGGGKGTDPLGGGAFGGGGSFAQGREEGPFFEGSGQPGAGNGERSSRGRDIFLHRESEGAAAGALPWSSAAGGGSRDPDALGAGAGGPGGDQSRGERREQQSGRSSAGGGWSGSGGSGGGLGGGGFEGGGGFGDGGGFGSGDALDRGGSSD